MTMKILTALFLGLYICPNTFAQFHYEPSPEFPFGQVNPDAPSQLADFDQIIGLSQCTSELRNPDGSWSEPNTLQWKWKYIMNGMGVQDETLQEGRFSAGSIRQFNSDSSAWFVHYYSSNAAVSTLPSWKGGKQENGDIILYREQTAPNGMQGYYKINFLNIDDDSFYWQGEWVNPDESIIYPTWKIDCKKIED